MTDEEIKTFIIKHHNNLTKIRERCWYEDCWTETVVDEDGVLKMVKEILEAEKLKNA